MEYYDVYWKNIHIGKLRVDTDVNKHVYDIDSEGVSRVKDETFLIVEMARGIDGFVDPIPFFENCLYNMKRNELNEIRYHTDYFVVTKTNPSDV